MGEIFLIFACLGLSGCIAPPIVTYVSMALDGASFIATGKSVGDHFISAAVNKDCALLRVITEQDVEAVCREYPKEDASEELGADQQEAATELTFKDDFKIPLMDVEAKKAPLLVAGDAEPSLPITDLGADLPGTITPAAFTESLGNRSAIYLMIGNFTSKEGAEKLAARVTGQMVGMSAAVAPAMAGDSLYFRVVAGPIAPGETDAAQSRLAAAGINNSWAAKLCSQNLGSPPCSE